MPESRFLFIINNMKPRVSQIAEKIEGLLKSDLRLTPGVLHYIESVAGICGPEEFDRQMAESGTCDDQSLFELIFYPDESLQAHLEPDLEPGALDEKEAKTIEEQLAAKKISTRLVFPGGGKAEDFTVPDNALCRYVGRLNLTRQIAAPVAETITTRVNERNRALQIRVKLRNARFGFSENIISFLCTYIEKMPVESVAGMERLEWVLEFLDRVDENTDIYIALMDEKRQAEEMLRQADNSEKRLRQQPVEALIMQGINVPCISADKARQNISAIDEIALRIFGETETGQPASPINLGVFDAQKDIEKVIKILS